MGGLDKATRAIVCFVEDNKHLIQQALALRQSWLYVQSPDTDLVIMGPPGVLAGFPDDVVKIEQRAVADDPEWRSYRFINSVATLDGLNADQLDRYSHILHTDVDTFITPAWNNFYPDKFVCGNGGYSNDENVRRKLHDIAAQLKLEHRGLVNTGSTWYGPTELVRRVAALTEMLTRYILSREFKVETGQWPGWFAGVSSMYAAEIAINHLVPDAEKTDQLDYFSTSPFSVRDYAHIHCWHTDEKFSKYWFMAGRYTDEDGQDLNLDIIADYAMEMSLRSLKDIPAAVPLIPKVTSISETPSTREAPMTVISDAPSKPQNYGLWWNTNNFDENWFKEIYSQYSNMHTSFMNWFGDLIRKGEAINSILEVGCGRGIPYASFFSAVEYFGLDISEKEIAYCKKTYGLPEDRFIAADIIEAPPLRQFDVVFSHAVIDHVYDINKFIRRLAAAASKHVYITAYNNWYPNLPQHDYLWSEDVTCYYNSISPAEARLVLSQFGFSKVEIFPFFTGPSEDFTSAIGTAIIASR